MAQPNNHTRIEVKADETNTTGSKKQPTKTGKPISQLFNRNVVLVLIIIFVALLPSAYFYHQSRQAEANLKSPDTSKKAVVDAVVNKVGKLILLPEGEQPTLATVSDVNKVKDQAFFRNAQNGDKVLIYTQARQAFMYRPSENKLIAVQPLSVNSQSNTAR